MAGHRHLVELTADMLRTPCSWRMIWYIWTSTSSTNQGQVLVCPIPKTHKIDTWNWNKQKGDGQWWGTSTFLNGCWLQHWTWICQLGTSSQGGHRTSRAPGGSDSGLPQFVNRANPSRIPVLHRMALLQEQDVALRAVSDQQVAEQTKTFLGIRRVGFSCTKLVSFTIHCSIWGMLGFQLLLVFGCWCAHSTNVTELY